MPWCTTHGWQPAEHVSVAEREKNTGANVDASRLHVFILLSTACPPWVVLWSSPPLMASTTHAEADPLEARIRQREVARANPLNTIPSDPAHDPRGRIPNTPLAVSCISFLLGILFCIGFVLFVTGGYAGLWWSTYQLGFFLAAWSAFHWGEFAVTAGWNKEKCSVSCEGTNFFNESLTDECTSAFLLENGSMYHIAHITALLEYLVILYYRPGFKGNSYVSFAGKSQFCAVVHNDPKLTLHMKASRSQSSGKCYAQAL